MLNHEFMKLFFFFQKHWPSTPTQIRGFYRLRDRILAPREAFTGWTGWYRGLPSHWIWVGVLLSFGFRWWWDKPPWTSSVLLMLLLLLLLWLLLLLLWLWLWLLFLLWLWLLFLLWLRLWLWLLLLLLLLLFEWRGPISKIFVSTPTWGNDFISLIFNKCVKPRTRKSLSLGLLPQDNRGK